MLSSIDDMDATIQEHGSAIEVYTARREMPPWTPSANCEPIANPRGLTDAEIALISEWVNDGMPEGNPADEPAPFVPTIADLGDPDVMLDKEPTDAWLPNSSSLNSGRKSVRG